MSFTLSLCPSLIISTIHTIKFCHQYNKNNIFRVFFSIPYAYSMLQHYFELSNQNLTFEDEISSQEKVIFFYKYQRLQNCLVAKWIFYF